MTLRCRVVTNVICYVANVVVRFSWSEDGGQVSKRVVGSTVSNQHFGDVVAITGILRLELNGAVEIDHCFVPATLFRVAKPHVVEDGSVVRVKARRLFIDLCCFDWTVKAIV